MDILFSLGQASGQEIQDRLADSPSYSTVRTILRVLERKGFVTHTEKDLKYVYKPSVPRDKARKSAVARLVNTFFQGSASEAVAAFLDPKTYRMSRSELDEISAMIEKAKKEAR